MPYENIPGVRAAFLDGEFAISSTTGQANVLVIGPGKSGRSNERFNVTSFGQAAREFGADTSILRVAHELLAQNARNISLMRSGGTQGSVVYTDSTSETLTITPEGRDDEILDRYALIIETSDGANRIIVYDLVDQEFVYDTLEILCLNEGAVEVEDTGLSLFTIGDKSLPDLATALSDIVAGDFTAVGTATMNAPTIVAGTDGQVVSLAEKYAALNSAYHLLDFKDADYVIPADVYIDDLNLADYTETSFDPTGYTTNLGKYGFYWKGAPVAGTSTDILGRVWQYEYRGKLYTYLVDVTDYASGVDEPAVAATKTILTDLVFTAQKTGKGGNALRVAYVVGAAGPTATAVETEFGIDITITDDGSGTKAAARTAVNNALAALTLDNGVVADTLVLCSSAGGGTLGLTPAAIGNFTGGKGGAVLTHEDLTGDSIPSAVSTRFTASVDAEFRECNFAHQLASHCYLASTTWSPTLGVISFKAPTGYGRSVVADWVGELPEFTDQGEYKYVDANADNGAGILGNKFLAGQWKTSAGYRSHLVVDGNSSDGYAYGGFILTVGASLPNAEPYGVDSGDEAVDSGGKPIDIGKHLFVTYDWPILTNGYNGGSTYRGDVAATFIGKLLNLPPNEEPIGLNGFVRNVSSPPRIHSSQLNALASIRAIGLRREDGFGLIFTSAKTAAHPDSDYTRASTIRCVSAMLNGIRTLAKPHIGKDYSVQRLISLQSQIDGYLVGTRGQLHEGAKARIEYTRAEKLAGILRIKLRMVPPFSIETIDVEISLAADESEL